MRVKKKCVSEKCAFVAGNFIRFAGQKRWGTLNVWSRLHYNTVRSERYTERVWVAGVCWG